MRLRHQVTGYLSSATDQCGKFSTADEKTTNNDQNNRKSNTITEMNKFNKHKNLHLKKESQLANIKNKGKILKFIFKKRMRLLLELYNVAYNKSYSKKKEHYL